MKKLIVLGIFFSFIFCHNFKINAKNSTFNFFDSHSIQLNDPLYVKVYLRILQKDNGSEGPTLERIFSIMEELDNIYNPHGIYFNYCITSELCSGCFDEYNHIIESEVNSLDIFTDGINGFIANWSNNPPHESIEIISRKFYASALKYIVGHEIGHCLGLYHTFQDNYCDSESEFAPYYVGGILKYGANCSYTGDSICDTPADPWYCGLGTDVNRETCEFSNPQIAIDYLGHPYIDPYGYLAKNVMSYYSVDCDYLITPGQANRIKMIMLDPSKGMESVIQNEEFVPVFNGDYYVAINELWNYNKEVIFNGDIIITPNNTLTIQSEYRFLPGNKIVVQTNGHLYLDGATLDVSQTSNCSGSSSITYWQGIRLDGNSFLTSINETKIKNAYFAISNTSFSGAYHWVNISDTWFLDNVQAVSIINSLPNFLHFTRTRFKNDPLTYSHGNIYRPAQIYFSNVYVPIFRECEIENNMEYLRPDGLQTYNSNLWMLGNAIKRWDNGVYCVHNIGKETRSIINENPLIDFCTTGINIKNGSNCMSNNIINNSSLAGIFFNSSNRYNNQDFIQIDNNFFLNGDKGLFLINALKGKVLENDFVGCHKGIIGSLRNYTDIFCNSFYESGNYDIGFSSGTDLGEFVFIPEQNTSAGNVFSATIPHQSFYHIDGENSIERIYNYKQPNEDPIKHKGVAKRQVSKDATCNGPNDPYNGGGDGNTDDEEDIYTEVKIEKDSKVDSLTTRIDGGNTPNVVFVIGKVTPLSAPDVTTLLVNLGPWMSEAAAEAMVDKQLIFSQNQYVSVFCANPDVLNSHKVYDFVFGSLSNFSEQSKQLIRNARIRGNERNSLVFSIHKLTEMMDNTAFVAKNKIVFQDNGPDFDKLREWENRREDFGRHFTIAETYLSEFRPDISNSYLQNIANSSGASVDQILEVNQYIALTNFLSTIYQNNRYEGLLNSSEITELLLYAHGSAEYAKQKARGILEFFYQYEFVDPPVLPRQQKIGYAFGEEYREEKPGVAVIPNPNNGMAVLELLTEDKSISISRVMVYNMAGKLVLDQQTEPMNRTASIELSEANKGYYIYSVIDSNGRKYSRKMIVQ